MSVTHQDGDLSSFSAQGGEHVESLRALIGLREPPEMANVQQATAATRALRGSASLLGLDVFQGFLGRLFHLLEDVESSEVPWSGRLESVLQAALNSESEYLESLRQGNSESAVAKLARAEEHLVTWRRSTTRRFEKPVEGADSQRADSQSAASGGVGERLDALAHQLRELRENTDLNSLSDDDKSALRTLTDAVTAFQQVVTLDAGSRPGVPDRGETGLRNHCEGGLRHLVDAAAQEVLDDAHERGVRLGLRATGALDHVDDELGGVLLEILRNLWSDSLSALEHTKEARIDTMFRVEAERLVVEIRDAEMESKKHVPVAADDVLSRYAGIRRSRPLIETLQGLVWVEPARIEGCRFRLALPMATERMQASVVRIGAHSIALPASAIDSVHGFAEVRANQDQAGAYVEIDGLRYPVLNLAFYLNDVSYDEIGRDLVMVVGSYERRAALFASGPTHNAEGTLEASAHGPWSGELVTDKARLPLLDVGALLGRRAQSSVPRKKAKQETTETGDGGVVLVVNSSDVERASLKGLLEQSGFRVVSVRTATEANSVLEGQQVDLVLCDLRLPEMNGQQIAEHRRRTGQFAETPILLYLSAAGEQAPLVVQQLGATDFIRSSARNEELMSVVKRLTEGS